MARTKGKRALLKTLHRYMTDLRNNIVKINYDHKVLVDLSSREAIYDAIKMLQEQSSDNTTSPDNIRSRIFEHQFKFCFDHHLWDDSLIEKAWNLILIDEVHKS
jgi:hypothetical protein